MVDGVVDDHELVLGLQPRALDHEVAVLHRGWTRHCNRKERSLQQCFKLHPTVQMIVKGDFFSLSITSKVFLFFSSA